MCVQCFGALEVVAKGPLLTADQLRVLGMLPLTELRLDSWAFKQQPTLSRPAFSHISNEGVKALVDAICARMVHAQEAAPLKLSLAGATTINHEAVSALLRLPVLTELDIAGCSKITPMDKMRLVAKVKAGRELLASGRPLIMRQARFPGLMIL
ncbi:hypothetical protein MNEG_8541 [Monoraphidium neglectum]|uniref:Uncharacterized protein n=1 Tax=Monoraphidium neglectum TaxID=145388 RepID=A0A0D2JJC1_9CHLO|nr:hypothetical protein MNEG_8541 [Monoraphidium neglectum]KIY99417.1 hypothetical protein MNEG_8541 [Monoraphidium neglectum]|eukprot:XP_013898437.1 hypothetical protein MNEG_8541 [Monoraphidium neglectum]